MTDQEECLRLLFDFVQNGEVEQAAEAAGTILAYLATLGSTQAQLAALEQLRSELESQCEGVTGPAEDRHVAVEDALDHARSTLASKSA